MPSMEVEMTEVGWYLSYTKLNETGSDPFSSPQEGQTHLWWARSGHTLARISGRVISDANV